MGVSLTAARNTAPTTAAVPLPLTVHAVHYGEGDTFALAMTERGNGALTLSRLTPVKDGKLSALVSHVLAGLASADDGAPVVLPVVTADDGSATDPLTPYGVKCRATGRASDIADALAVGLLIDDQE